LKPKVLRFMPFIREWKAKPPPFEGSYELIVLDVMLPDKKGFEVLKEIRAHDVARCLC